MNPIVVHVVRPYASEQEYLAAEAWSIDSRSMVLLDAEALPTDTALLFDVALADGHKPIRAEGRAAGFVPASEGRPGGLRVRFKRFGAATKAFIERAVQAKSSSDAAASAHAASEDRLSSPEARTTMTEIEGLSPAAPPVAPSPSPQHEPSGVRLCAPGPVTAPQNRDELLARLRERKQAR